MKYYTLDSIRPQLECLLNGIFSVMEPNLLSVFDEDELEYFMCGEDKIDVNDWRLNTKYRGPLNENSDVIVWFWKIIEDLDDERKHKFLQFCTGASRVPAEGFAYMDK